MTAPNRVLAATARAEADQAMRHRRAWLCVAVLLDTTRTVAAARAALADVPEPLRGLTSRLLDHLTDDGRRDDDT